MTNWPELLVVIRHGEAVLNTMTLEERIQQGHINHSSPLTEKGIQQAQIIGEHITERYGKFAAHYTSPMTRAAQTAGYGFPGIYFQQDSRWREVDRGIQHRYTDKQIAKLFPEECERMKKEGYFYRPPEGESNFDAELRVHNVLQSIRMDHPKKKVLVVAHGHIMIHLWKIMENHHIEIAAKRHAEGIPHCSCLVFKYDKKSKEIRTIFIQIGLT